MRPQITTEIITLFTPPWHHSIPLFILTLQPPCPSTPLLQTVEFSHCWAIRRRNYRECTNNLSPPPLPAFAPCLPWCPSPLPLTQAGRRAELCTRCVVRTTFIKCFIIIDLCCGAALISRSPQNTQPLQRPTLPPSVYCSHSLVSWYNRYYRSPSF